MAATNDIGKTTHGVALGLGTFLSGFMFSMGLITSPALLNTNTDSAHLLKQWESFFRLGHSYAAPTVMITSLLHAATAWRKYSTGRSWTMSAIAAAVTVIPWPYTWLFLDPVNRTLLGWNAGSAPVALSTVQELFMKSTRLHLVRCAFPLAGALIGWTALRDWSGLKRD